jgi:hypothetical protein
MILVCNLYNDVELVYDVPYVKVINLPYDFNHSLYKNIGLAGIELEDELFKYDSIIGLQKYTQAVIVWDSNSLDLKKIHESLNDIRSDEIYLESIKTNYKHSWISGHKNAVIVLASAIMSTNTLVLNDYERAHKNLITWYANRIGLNVFEI